MDDVIVARSFSLKVIFEGFVGTRAQQLHVDRHPGLLNRLNQRTGDGAVVDVLFFTGAGGDHQQVNGGRRVRGGSYHNILLGAAHHGAVQRQRTRQIGVF